MKYLKQQKERRERLKKEGKCVVCGVDLPENCNFFRCFRCRVRQSQADRRYKEKKKVIDYLKSLVLDAENVGSKFTAGVNLNILREAISIIEFKENKNEKSNY